MLTKSKKLLNAVKKLYTKVTGGKTTKSNDLPTVIDSMAENYVGGGGGGGNDPYTFNLFELGHYVKGKHLNVDNFIALINQMPEKEGEHIIPYIPIGVNYSGMPSYIGIRNDGSSTYFNAGYVSYPECSTVDEILSNKNEIESVIFDDIDAGEYHLVDDTYHLPCNMQAYVFGKTDWEYLGKLTKEQLFGLFTE